MTKLLEPIKAEVEECIRWQMWIPPCIMPDGRKLKPIDKDGHITGKVPPINFLLYDKDNNELIPAKFHAMTMQWELV